MDKESITLENVLLKASWDCFPADHLATYLGVEEQDQRINTHSILTRALLIDTLWPGMFDDLIDGEFRFGIVMTWLLRELKSGATRYGLQDELYASPPSQRIPGIVSQTAAWLQLDTCPIPDYLSEALMFLNPDHPPWYLFEPALNTFRGLWSAHLAGQAAEPIHVLELACGSGNDFKAIRDCGLAAHLRYSGFDISWKNIRNACDLFPGVDFFEASILDSGLPDNSYDYIFVHDMIGHLSPRGMEVALGEIMRIVRKEAWLHCYNVANIDRHEIHPFQSYYRNRLSIPQVTASLEMAGAAVETISISDLSYRKFGYVPDYTATSGTFLARKVRR
jgi:SAM-dependent methyltransferase